MDGCRGGTDQTYVDPIYEAGTVPFDLLSPRPSATAVLRPPSRYEVVGSSVSIVSTVVHDSLTIHEILVPFVTAQTAV